MKSQCFARLDRIRIAVPAIVLLVAVYGSANAGVVRLQGSAAQSKVAAPRPEPIRPSAVKQQQVLSSHEQDTGVRAESATDGTLEPAMALLREGRMNEARAWLTEAFLTARDKPHPDVILAQFLSDSGRVVEARRVMEALAVKEPDRLDIRLIFCELATRESRWFDGLIHAKEAERATAPKNWSVEHTERVRNDVLMLKAACLEGRGEWSAARTIYGTLAKQNNPSPNVFSALGRCAVHMDNTAEAAHHFARAFELDSRRDAPHLAIAVILNSSGKTSEAETHFRQAIRHSNSRCRSRARLAFARWLLWNNRAREVAPILTTKLGSPDQDYERQLLLAMAARMSNQLDHAGNLLSPIHRNHPTNFAVGNQLALVLIESSDEGRRSRAQQIAEANARNYPQQLEAWSTLGWIQFRLGDLASAKQNLARATSGGAISRDTAWHLAQVHRKLGNGAEAEKLLAAARDSKGPVFANVRVLPWE